jgi:hypothetical protein
MKKKLSLAKLSQNELSNLKGGQIANDITLPSITGPNVFHDPSGGTITIGQPTLLCLCGCWYADQGGSSSDANADANMEGGLISVPPR